MKLKIGDKVGRLTVVDIEKIVKGNETRMFCICQCDCGNIKKIRMDSLTAKNGKTQSCGCYAKEMSSRRKSTHKMTDTITYQSWFSMRSRCFNPNNPSYSHYGAIGISVCERWRNSFVNFLTDMGERPSKDYSIDRIDVNGDYEPNNCRWATQIQQQNNKKNNNNITYNGETHTITDWARILGVKASIIYTRKRRGKSPQECLSTKDNRKYHFKEF